MTFNIRKFFGFCEHQWETITRYNTFEHFWIEPKTQTGELVIQKCSKCGKLKKVKLII